VRALFGALLGKEKLQRYGEQYCLEHRDDLSSLIPWKSESVMLHISSDSSGTRSADVARLDTECFLYDINMVLWRMVHE